MRLQLLAVIALCVVGLSGCGSTIGTRIYTRDVLDRSRIGQSARQAWRIEKRSGIGPSSSFEEAAQALARWAGGDSDRLALAAEAVLDMRPKGLERIRGFALGALQLAFRSLQASGVPESRWLATQATHRAISVYNAALDRFVSLNPEELARGMLDQAFWTPFGRIAVSTKYLARSPYRVGYFDTFIAADHVSIRGMGQRIVSEGLGVALVGVRKRTAARDQEMYYQPTGRGVFAPFVAVARFDSATNASHARIDLFDLNRYSEIATSDGRVVLSGDFTAPYALSFRGINDLLMGISGVIDIEKRSQDAGLYLTEPFDPDRIPVVMIHGLASSPLVWRAITTELMADPTIRKCYQFWYVYYPTGMPVAESAALIRDDISTIRKTFDPRGTSVASRHMIIVGYSMGGVIARILSTNIGTRYWDAIAKIPFDQAPIDSEDRAVLRKLLFWSPVPGLDRTVFIATPHRGTRLADSTFAGIGQRLVGLPKDFLQFRARILSALGNFLQGDFFTARALTGISSLSPSAPIYQALDGAPFAPRLKFDSIIGDRGKGGGVESTDGIVGYWSSHLDGAQSELIVPTGHDAQLHPNTIADLRRILTENLRSIPSAIASGPKPCVRHRKATGKSRLIRNPQTSRRRDKPECWSRSASHAEDRSKSFAEHKAGAYDCGAEEAHGPNAERAGYIASIAEQLIELVDSLCDRIVLLSLRQDQRVTDFEHGKGECEQASGKKVCNDERYCDFQERSERRAAQVLSSFLKGYARLLKSCGSGTNNVREPANAIGDYENRQRILDRIERREKFSLLGHGQITERQNNAGNRQRKHGRGVENLATGKLGAHNDIGDGDAQNDVHKSGEAGIFKTVLNGRKSEIMAEGFLEVLKRPGARKDRVVPITRKGYQNDPKMWKHGQGGNRAEGECAERAHHGACLARSGLARGFGDHGMSVAAESPFACRIKEHRGSEHDSHKGERKWVASDVANAGKDLHRGHPRELEHQGHAQFRKSPDKDDRPAGEEPRHNERKRDSPEFSQAGASQVFRGFFHGGIKICQGSDEVEIKNGIEVQGIHHDDSPKPALTQPVDGVFGAHEAKSLQ
jgi:pimeloyl-ACP methyl ester carboxylesterase